MLAPIVSHKHAKDGARRTRVVPEFCAYLHFRKGNAGSAWL